MKKFENPFSALVALSDVGNDVVVAKVTTSMRVSVQDRDFLGTCILEKLLPDCVFARRFYDGSFVIVSSDFLRTVTNACVSHDPATIEFDADIELEDGMVHEVRFSLEKSTSVRRDYAIGDTRSIVLRGIVTLDVDDDETVEA